MIQIPYQRRALPTNTAGIMRVGSVDSGGQAIAEGIAVAGRELRAYGQGLVDHERLVKRGAASEALAGERLFWTQELPKLEEAAKPGADGFTDGVRSTFQERRAALVEQYGDDPETLAYVTERLGYLEADILGQGIGIESKARGELRAAKVKAVTSTLADAVFANPGQYQAAEEELTLAIAGMELGSNTAGILQEEREKLAEAYYRGKLEADPAGTLAELRAADGPAALLSTGTRHGLTNAAQGAVRQAEREAEADQETARRRSAIEAGDLIYDPTRSLGDMLDEARKVEDPELRALTVGQVQRRYSEAKAAEADRQQRASDAAWKLIDGGGRLEDLPAPVLADLDRRDKAAIQAFTAAREKSEPIRTDWPTYGKLMNATAAQLMATDLNKFRAVLADSEFRQLVERQAGFRKGTEPDKPGEPGTLTQQISSAADAAKLDPDKGQVGQFQAVVRAEVDQQQRALGRALTYDERQKIVDRLTLTVTTARYKWWPNTERRAFQLGEGEHYELTPGNIAEQRDTLARLTGIAAAEVLPTAEKLEAAGVPVTETTLKMAAALVRQGTPVTRETMEALAALAEKKVGGS